MSGARLEGRVCLLSGASRGLGRAVAKRLAREGASLVLACRGRESVASLRGELAAAGARPIVTVEMDLRDTSSVRTVVPRAKQAGVDRIDVLVNVAAVLGPVGKAWENPAEEWEDAITANLVSPALLCASVVPLMKERGRGKIVNVSGGGATGPRPNFSAYAAAKAGLVRYSETLAEEVKDLGISVNCVAPGAMGTDMLALVEKLGPSVAGEREVAAAMKAKGAGKETLERAADLIAFLASDESEGITGKLISAVWDDWRSLPMHLADLQRSDVYAVRRITAKDRGFSWGDL